MGDIASGRVALIDLIREWQKTEAYKAAMLNFFAYAFQQTQLENVAFGDWRLGVRAHPGLLPNMAESFARTAWHLIESKRPFTDTLTTQEYMLTPALAMLYAAMDAYVWASNRKMEIHASLKDKFERLKITLQDQRPIPLEETFNERSKDYLNFYLPKLKDSFVLCDYYQPLVFTAADFRNDPTSIYYNLITVSQFAFSKPPASNFGCRLRTTQRGKATPVIPFLQPEDFTQWRWVKIRQPQNGETPTAFWEKSTLAKGDTLILNTPRIGFFTTPAFFFNWTTNSGNQHRVTINQTLAVAVGAVFDGTDDTLPLSLQAVDREHAAEGTPCYRCHRQLDPMRQFFAQNFSYHNYTNPLKSDPILGSYGVNGVQQNGQPGAQGLLQLANLLSQDARFPLTWVHRLCSYVNASPCDMKDSQLQKIAENFKNGGYNWHEMVAELFASSLVTYNEPSLTMMASQGVVPLVKKVQLCQILANRLNITHLCDLLDDIGQRVLDTIPQITYSRGLTFSQPANDATFFFRGAIELICSKVALLVAGSRTTNERFGIDDIDAAINKMVEFMGVDSANQNDITQLLKEHYDSALQTSKNKVRSLQSTFTVACMSPYITGLGI
jgi:hypothetical protein